MESKVSRWRSWLGRATIYLALGAAIMLSSAGCGANGKLFGRKPAPPPATVKDFLMLPRPE